MRPPVETVESRTKSTAEIEEAPPAPATTDSATATDNDDRIKILLPLPDYKAGPKYFYPSK